MAGLRGWRAVVQHQMTSYGFTPAEQRVAWSLFDGYTNTQIGTMLDASSQTIKNHMTRMLHKTKTTSRLELALVLLDLEDDEAPAAVQHAEKTHCKHGHEFSEANTYRRRDGRRECRICAERRTRAHLERQVQKTVA